MNTSPYYKTTEATREFGYQPRSMHESLTDTVKWFLGSTNQRLTQATLQRIVNAVENEEELER